MLHFCQYWTGMFFRLNIKNSYVNFHVTWVATGQFTMIVLKDLLACAHAASFPVHVAFLILDRGEHGPCLPQFSIKKATCLGEKVESTRWIFGIVYVLTVHLIYFSINKSNWRKYLSEYRILVLTRVVSTVQSQ